MASSRKLTPQGQQPRISAFFNPLPSSDVRYWNGRPVPSDFTRQPALNVARPPFRPSAPNMSFPLRLQVTPRFSSDFNHASVRVPCGPFRLPAEGNSLLSGQEGFRIYSDVLDPPTMSTATDAMPTTKQDVFDEDDGFLAATDAYEASLIPSQIPSLDKKSETIALNDPDDCNGIFDEVDIDFEELDKVEKLATQNPPSTSCAIATPQIVSTPGKNLSTNGFRTGNGNVCAASPVGLAKARAISVAVDRDLLKDQLWSHLVQSEAAAVTPNEGGNDLFEDADFDFDALDKLEKQATVNRPLPSVRPPVAPQPFKRGPVIAGPSRPHVSANVPPLNNGNGGTTSPVPEILEDLPPTTQIPANVEKLPGFDLEAGLKWIYPTNYDIRSYQFNIVQKALFRNTMVCLPTGMGKTFIAAVIMYNFYRWYPKGRIMFMAPTRPLVDQQIQACYRVMGIPQDEMVELTGQTPQAKRADLWARKRIVFLTPQIAVNDLDKDVYKASDVKCLVIDEAHKASGNHHYVQIVRLLAASSKQFRILALSATPGNDRAQIQKVLTSLQINHIEIRQEDSIDLMKYTHRRNVEKIVIPLGNDVRYILDRLLAVMIPIVNKMKQYGGIPRESDPLNLCQYSIVQFQRNFSLVKGLNDFVKRETSSGFIQLITLYHCYELLMMYGIRAFYYSLHETLRPATADKKVKWTGTLLGKNAELQRLMGNVREYLGIDVAAGESMRSFREDQDKPYIYGHPKLQKLEELVLQHFASSESKTDEAGPSKPLKSVDSRIIVFTTYRDSVHEIVRLLERHRPLINPTAFVGQADSASKKGLQQKEQLAVMQKFRSGNFNVLVSTCVGEEGLDIGEVDLIICFDSQKSAIRNVQRTGRTGRKREGKTVFLLAEGREENKYRTCQSSKSLIQKTLTNFSGFQMCPDVARMVPNGLNPVCVKLQWTVPDYCPEMGRQSRTSVKGKKASKENVGKAKKTRLKFMSEDEHVEWERHCSIAEDKVPISAERRFLYDPSTFSELCRTFRERAMYEDINLNRPVLDVGTNPLSQHLPHAEIFNSFLISSARTNTLVSLMRQINDNAMDFDEASYDPTCGKMYEEAVLAGFIELSDTELITDTESDVNDKPVRRKKSSKRKAVAPKKPDPFADSDEDVEKAKEHRQRLTEMMAAHKSTDKLDRPDQAIGLRKVLQQRLDHLDSQETPGPLVFAAERPRNIGQGDVLKLLDGSVSRKMKRNRLDTLETPPNISKDGQEKSFEVTVKASILQSVEGASTEKHCTVSVPVSREASKSSTDVARSSMDTSQQSTATLTSRASETTMTNSTGSTNNQGSCEDFESTEQAEKGIFPPPAQNDGSDADTITQKGLEEGSCEDFESTEQAEKGIFPPPAQNDGSDADTITQKGLEENLSQIAKEIPKLISPVDMDRVFSESLILPDVQKAGDINVDIQNDMGVDIANWEQWDGLEPKADTGLKASRDRLMEFERTTGNVESTGMNSTECRDVMTFTTALQFVNQTSEIIPESPLAKQSENGSVAEMPTRCRLNFDDDQTKSNLAEAKMAVLASDTVVPLSRGPSSHSTPVISRSRKRMLASPNLSPVREIHRKHDASPSRILASYVSEKEMEVDVIMASFSEDESDDDKKFLSKDVIPSSLPYDTDLMDDPVQNDTKINPPFPAGKSKVVDAVVQLQRKPVVPDPFDYPMGRPKKIDENEGNLKDALTKSSRRKESVVLVESPLKAPPADGQWKPATQGSRVRRKAAVISSALKQQNQDSPCAAPIDVPTNNDDEEEEIIIRHKRRRPVAAFDTPSPSRAASAARSERTAPPKPKLNVGKGTNTSNRPKKNLKKLGRQFLCTQAECSDERSADEAEEDEPDDEYPASFVDSGSDETNPTYMHAIYARDLVETPNRDLIMGRLGPRKFREDVFSQPFEQDPDYGSDSFVAYSEEETSPPQKSTKPKPVAKAWDNDFRKPHFKGRRKK
ncbi:uncharacterized protein LOC129602184 [Paramacrobiotus metropolitanus]|uniref:uncharacterized protein LOC129602184 n=1 Tax=Paramacrobiotus metropolitanus TaxID=2943436 RepID=UPI002445F3E9|nr:uncharacterized protein LOC129602184 [Paramacrobiotus metropolitanus]